MNDFTSEPKRFSDAMFKAALAYYGLPADYPRVFTKDDTIQGLFPCKAQEACEAYKPTWVQVNLPAFYYPVKKASNVDIETLLNLTLDVEYSPDPQKLRVIVIQLVEELISMGLAEEGLPIEDSGAGNHIVLPLTPLKVVDLGGGELVNKALASIVNQHIEPVFNRLLHEYGLTGLRPELAKEDGKPRPVKLECFDLSRILSVPGTWRPGGTKPNEPTYLAGGYLRRWLYPYDTNYPQRKESKDLADMVRAYCVNIKAEQEAAEKAKAEWLAATQPFTLEGVNSEDPAAWLRGVAPRYTNKGDRSADFQALVSALWVKYGDVWIVEAQAELIDELSGSKYGSRAAGEVKRSLAKATQLPRTSQADWYAAKGYSYEPECIGQTSIKNGGSNTEMIGTFSGLPTTTVHQEKPLSKQHHLTDLGNARRMVEQFGQDMRFVSQWGWMNWDGRRWELDRDGAIKRRAKSTIESIYAEAGRLEDSEKRAATADHAKRSEAKARIDAMISLAESELEVVARPEDFDTNPWLLSCRNGTIDLVSGKLLPFSRDYLISKLVPIEYEPESECPTFLKFLDTIMGGNLNLIRFLQLAIGYSLTGSTSEQVLFLLWGTGRNGKSTLLEILALLLGDYAQQSDFNTFLERSGEGPRNDIARLAGARLISAVEADSSKRMSESVIKQLTGGDRITARFLNKEYFEFRPTFKLFLAANHRPQIKGQDLGIWRRVRLIPFMVTIPENEVDKGLLDKLKNELPGIFAWAVQGCLDWQREGLKAPKEVTEATEEYKDDSDPLRDFLAECTVSGPGKQVEFATFRKTYTQWCDELGEHPFGIHRIRECLQERGLVVKAGTGNKRMVHGLALLSPDSKGRSPEAFLAKAPALF